MPFKPDWSFANEFVCNNTGVFVKVTKTNHMVPQFSIAEFGRYKEVETRNGGTKQVPVNFIGIRAEKDNITSGNLEWDQADALLEQIQNAYDWIVEEHKLNCQYVREMKAEENSDSKPVTRKTHSVQNGNVKKDRRQSVRVESEQSAVSYDEAEVADAVA